MCMNSSLLKNCSFEKQYPDAAILVHPECKGAVAKLADKVGSTAGLLKYAIASDKRILSLLRKVEFCTRCVNNALKRTLFPLRPKTALALAMNVISCG